MRESRAMTAKDIATTFGLPYWKIRRLAIAIAVCSLLVLEKATTMEEPLYLLNVIPFEDDHPNADWDRGLEISPAAHLAKDQINNRTDLLPGYELRVLDVDSEACGFSVITKGLVNMYSHLIDPELHVVGVIGMFCSSVTNVLVPVVDHPGIDYVTIAGSTSPPHRNTEEFPRLFHTISSSTIFNKAVIKLKEEFDWNFLALVYDTVGIYFHSTGTDFLARNRNFLLTVSPITPELVYEAINLLEQNGSRVIYGSVTAIEAARLVCKTYQRGLSYPGYVYMFHDRTITELLDSAKDTSCSKDELIEGMSGTLFVRYKLQLEPDLHLYSGITYEEYYEEYANQLPNGRNTSEYANVQYDQVWAFALALNSSLQTLNGSLTSYSFGDKHITDVIVENLERLDFQGAAGRVKFDENRHTRTVVEIFQVFNSTENLVAVYLPSEDQLEFTESGKHLRDTIPKDRFDSVYTAIPLWLAIVIFIVAALVILLITVVLVLLVVRQNRPEIKASSPLLSLCMLVGCYLLSIPPVIQTIHGSFFIASETFLVIVCYSDSSFGSIGLLLIYGTLLVRMLRVYRVFSYFGKTSRYWQDSFLFLGIMVMCFTDIVILIMWISVDPIETDKTMEYINVSPQPYYQTSLSCTSQFFIMWVVIIIAYPCIIILLVVFLAFRTRHIKRKHFKDTKKVNAFIFSTLVTSPLLLALWRIFLFLKLSILSHISLCAAFLFIATLCQIFILFPKITPFSSTLTVTYSNFADSFRKSLH